MNYLELVQKAIDESGAHLDTPDSLSNLDGLSRRVAGWIQDAWNEIQLERRDYHFNQEDTQVFTVNTSSGEDAVLTPDEIAVQFRNNWKLVALRELWIHDAEYMERVPKKLRYISYTDWPDVFGRSPAYREYNATVANKQGTPKWWTIDLQGRMYLYPTPDKVYTIEFTQPRVLQELQSEEDVPILPSEYHMMIVWRALMEYGFYHDDGSVLNKARAKYTLYKKRLESYEMPDVVLRTDSLYRSC